MLMLVCAILGGLIHCLKHIFINEYNLPEEQNRYLHMKFLVVELEYIGKTLGGFLAMGTVMEEPSTLFTCACWMSFSISQLCKFKRACRRYAENGRKQPFNDENYYKNNEKQIIRQIDSTHGTRTIYSKSMDCSTTYFNSSEESLQAKKSKSPNKGTTSPATPEVNPVMKIVSEQSVPSKSTVTEKRPATSSGSPPNKRRKTERSSRTGNKTSNRPRPKTTTKRSVIRLPKQSRRAVGNRIITLAGLRIFHEQKDNRNIIKEFIKHTFFAMRSQLRNRRDESEKFSTDDEERIKMVHSVLPLYVPVIILIGLKDLKYSRYIWQTTQLSLNAFNGSYNPQKILIFYPLTVSVFLPLYHYGLNPLLKKLMTLRMRTTTRAIVSFYFMALSLSFATILECRIELDHKSVRVNNTVSVVEMYNFLPCTALLSVNCQGHVKYEVPPLDLITMRCPLTYDYNAVLIQGICVIEGVSRFYSMTAVLSRQQEVRVAFGYDLSSSKIIDRKSLPIFFQHLHQRNMEIPQLPRLTIIYNVVEDHVLRIVPTSHTVEGWVPSGPDIFEKSLKNQHHSHIAQVEIVKDGWYAVLIDNMMMGKVNYKTAIKTFTVMISQDDPKNETVVKIILVRQIPSRHVLHQLPQVIMSAFAEMMIEAPGFVYGRKKVPLQWNDFVTVVWTFCSFLGNLIIIIGGFVSHVERNLSAFLIGSACSIVAIALISVFLLDYYRADYVEG
ncbi:hypothetical protein GE061_004828 [Apolygus lucorum]|uniref:Uncharacterized protein n=1 Tax=Apolygus lucorum TaxID=248454 RepID=A0A8S9X1T0_APOLU|nr:hypothetical protein GE061_004828 [Apolygus lucorum]